MSYIISCSSQRSIKSIQSNKLLRKLHLILVREWTRLIRRNNINQILPPIQLLQMLHLEVLIWKWFSLCFIYFPVQKCKKRENKIFLARSKMKLFFVAACGAVHSNLKLFTLPISNL